MRCARVRVQLLQLEIDEVGTALNHSIIPPEFAVSWLGYSIGAMPVHSWWPDRQQHGGGDVIMTAPFPPPPAVDTASRRVIERVRPLLVDGAATERRRVFELLWGRREEGPRHRVLPTLCYTTHSCGSRSRSIWSTSMAGGPATMCGKACAVMVLKMLRMFCVGQCAAGGHSG